MSPYSPLLFAFYWETLDAFLVRILFVLWLNRRHICNINAFALHFLCNMLFQDSLSSFLSLGFLLWVIQVSLTFKPNSFLFFFKFSLGLNIFNLSLGLFLQLIMQRNEEVLLPQIKLSLESICLFDVREETVVMEWQFTKIFKLLPHSVYHLLLFFAIHCI